MELSHIVVASDLSQQARRAYPHAAFLARAFDARLTLLHVDAAADKHVPGTIPGSQWWTEFESAREARFAEAQSDFAAAGVEIEIQVVPGDPKTEIDAWVRSQGADLVIMTRQSHSGLERLVHLGSTAARVLRLTDVPVLVVHHSEKPEFSGSYDRIVFGTDLTPAAEAGLTAAMDFASTVDALVTVTHVVQSAVPLAMMFGEDIPGVPVPSTAELEDDYGEQLRGIVRERGDSRLTWKLLVGENAADTLVEGTQEMGGDLLCVPATSRGPLQRVMLGSTAERLVRRSEVPVLVLPHAFLARYGLVAED